MPIIIEVVDTEEMNGQLLPFPDEHVTEGLITMEKVQVIKYGQGAPPDSLPLHDQSQVLYPRASPVLRFRPRA